MDNETEVWKSHPEYAGIEVSTLGRVRTLDKMVWNGRGTYLLKGRVLKPGDRSDGYLQVKIKVNGKWTMKLVHRLVAKTFITNPDNLPQVNHKDCDKTNNHVDNLEFCTASYNMKYREEFGKASGHPIFAINLKTLEVSRFSSQHEASRVLGLQRPNVSAVIKGRLKQTGGYRFENANAE